MSGFNAFIKTNIDLFAAELPYPAADLVISKGKMAKTAITVVTAVPAATSLTIAWADDAGVGYKLASDVPYAVVVNSTQEVVVTGDGLSSASDRSDLSLVVQYPAALVDADALFFYLAFKRADGTIVSNTAFKE